MASSKSSALNFPVLLSFWCAICIWGPNRFNVHVVNHCSMFISQLTARRLGICQMDTCLAHASPMDKWFPLTANMAMSWLEIAAFVVLMEDGILLSRNVKVSNSSTSQEKFFTNILWLINWEQHILTIWEGLSKKYRNSVYFYFGSIYLFYICCHYVYCEDREIHRNQYRRILSIQLGHLEWFLSSCTHRVPLFTLSDLLTFVQLSR